MRSPSSRTVLRRFMVGESVGEIAANLGYEPGEDPKWRFESYDERGREVQDALRRAIRKLGEKKR